MEEITIEGLFRISKRKIQNTPTSFHRYLYDKINWNSKVIGIKGAKGVGKTTLMLQHVKETFDDFDKVLYVSLDNIWFTTHPLMELVELFYSYGGTHLFLDEVHKYPNWQTIIKNLADDYPDMYIVYTGSSMLKIDHSKGDMSRRQLMYTLHGLSFREFLEYEYGYKVAPVSIEELLKKHGKIAAEISSQQKILALFNDYLHHGFYPFYKQDLEGFESKLLEVIDSVLNDDLPAVEDITFATVQKTRKLLMILAERCPQTPKMNELYSALETTRDQGLKMLYSLERAALIGILTTQSKNVKTLVKPDKIMMNNPNLMYALTSHADIGSIRESFFHNQLSAVTELHYPEKGDFLVERKYLFEVGGRKKSFEQIKDEPNSYLAVDNTDVGVFNRIPLWMFGLLY